MKDGRGFTQVELVVALVLVGILAAMAIPRFVGRVGFDARGFYDEAQALVRYGQKMAIAQHRNVSVDLSGGQLRLCFDTGCSQPVPDPAGAPSFVRTAPSGVNIAGPAAFAFDPLGRPNPNAAMTYTIAAAGEPTRSFTVERETGYVHP
ncbi:MAG: pilus assembly FimT family protein [Pseudomonadota bacterium]|jgi:MSHA pilin protein MshC